MARLEHPHIVPLYDYVKAGGAYLVMRYLRGGTLDATLRTRQPVADSLTLVAEVAYALEVAHRHGVVHRELTAKSILLDGDGAGYLSDFGLAFEPDNEHRVADDVRAMGFVLGELLSAPYPLDRRSGPPEVVRRVRPDVPPDVLDVLTRATVARNGDGFASAADLADACLQAVPGRPLRTPAAQNAPVGDIRPQPVQGSAGVPGSRRPRLLRPASSRRPSRRTAAASRRLTDGWSPSSAPRGRGSRRWYEPGSSPRSEAAPFRARPGGS